jgi:uncharacterized membrane protein YfcA
LEIGFEVLAIAAIFAFGVGILTGIFGVGGGFLLVPALLIFTDMDDTVAVGTVLAVALINSCVAIFKRRKTGTVDYKLAMFIGSGSICGVLVGSKLLERLSEMPKINVGGNEIDTTSLVLLSMFAVLLTWLGGYFYYDSRRVVHADSKTKKPLLGRIDIHPMIKFKTLEDHKISAVVLIAFGFLAGTLSGLMGIGGAIIMLPVLIYLLGQVPTEAVGTCLAMVFISCLTGVTVKAFDGDIYYPMAIAMAAGGVFGAVSGTKIGLRLPASKLKLYFVYIVLTALALVVTRLVTMLI